MPTDSRAELLAAERLAAAQAVTAPKPFDAAAFLASAPSGAAAAQAVIDKMTAAGSTPAEAASSARYTGQAYDYYAAQKAAADAAAARAKAEAEAAAKAKALADAEAAKLAAGRNAADNPTPTITSTGNISTAGAGAPTTTPTQTAAEKALADIAAQAAADAVSKRQNAFSSLSSLFAKYGLETLVPKIQELIVGGAGEATITLALQASDEYKARFKANDIRVSKGLAALNPAEYISLEGTYRQVLRAYGLNQFNTNDYVSQFIANDVSPTELTNRVVTAVQRVQNANPAIQATLKDYYGIGSTDLVAYVLDPENQMANIQKQVTASEIGAAAKNQGLQANKGTSEQLAAQGITQDQARQGYSTIGDILPTAEKLSSIYGTALPGYNQTTAEQEVFNQSAEAKRTRQKLAATEIGTFSGSAGTSRGSFSTQYLNKSSSSGQF